MFIHSVMPNMFLLPEDTGTAREFKDGGGYMCEGTQTPEGFKIERIISTDPKHYLDKGMSPGSYYTALPKVK